jgi:hypothetical protein
LGDVGYHGVMSLVVPDLNPAVEWALWDAYRGHRMRLFEASQKLAESRDAVAELEQRVAQYEDAVVQLVAHAEANGVDLLSRWAAQYGDPDDSA